MDSFITKDGKKLKRGYTSGSCAAAASKAAAIMLFAGERLKTVHLTTPSGIGLDLPVQDIEIGGDYVSCGIVKDSGDDPDVTNGMCFYAKVEKAESSRTVTIEGGAGIGRVTKPGLDQPVGNAAINTTPRRMISEALKEICEEYGYEGGLKVTISVPGGEEIAQKTFNPRLGIVGGISILGTTGIIDPMSDDAVVETIRTELSIRKAMGAKTVLLTPGNYGADFIKNELGIDPGIAVTISNYIGDALYAAEEYGFDGVLLVGHIGKLVKLAAGMFHTHSRYGDGRKEIFAAHAGKCGASSEIMERIMDSAVTEDMLQVLEEIGLRNQVMESIMSEIEEQIRHRTNPAVRAGVIAFSRNFGMLGKTEYSDELLNGILLCSLFRTRRRNLREDCACGIAVRSIAPHLKSKTEDPAGRFSCDVWGAAHNCGISSMETAKEISAAILTEEIPVCSEFELPAELPDGLIACGTKTGEKGIYIGTRMVSPFPMTLRLIPRIVTLGVGCKRGTSADLIQETVFGMLEKENIDAVSLSKIATIDLKSDENGLLEFAKRLGLPINFLSAEELAAVEDRWGFSESDFVRRTTGVGNVCERAAVSGGGELIVKKTAKNGVTVAAAYNKWRVIF